jgi:hypothetical protein
MKQLVARRSKLLARRQSSILISVIRTKESISVAPSTFSVTASNSSACGSASYSHGSNF